MDYNTGFIIPGGSFQVGILHQSWGDRVSKCGIIPKR